jgi:ABC-type siderophore export system fused ATPase/permease subunit
MRAMSLDWTLGTILPLLLLAGAGAAVPVALYRLHGPALRALALNLLASAMLLILAGGAVFVVLYALQGADLSRRPLAALLHFLRLGLSSAIVWLPVLLLTGIALGQRSEARLAKLREEAEALQDARVIRLEDRVEKRRNRARGSR